MTYYEKIKELVEKDNEIAIGKLICEIHGKYCPEEIDPCETCSANAFCWANHNGFVDIMDQTYKKGVF